MTAGRRAALPGPGYVPNARDRVSENMCRVTFTPERGGTAVVFDLTDLPVSPQLRLWLASALAKATGPSGSARTLASARSYLGVTRSFARYLASLDNPPRTTGELGGSHWAGYLLAQRDSSRRTQSINLRSLLRHADDVPAEFAARMQRTQIPRSQDKFHAYSADEFERVIRAARTSLRDCVRRIHNGRTLLARWRDGIISRDETRVEWERGWLLDHIDRHDDVPRFPGGSRHRLSTMHGGTIALFAELYPTPLDLGAAAALVICLTGHNLSSVQNLPARYHRPDGDAGASRTVVVDVVKPRRGPQHAHMSVALHEPARSRSRDRLDLSSPFSVYDAIRDITEPARARAGSDLLFVYFTPKRGAKFRPGLRDNIIAEWGRAVGLVGDNVDNEGRAVPLGLDSRRLRMTWLERHQQPVAHTEQTLANDYLARNRGNLAEYQQIVATTLNEQVAAARSSVRVRALTSGQVDNAATNPEAVAAETDLDRSVVTDLVEGRLDTVLTGCVDNLHSPYTDHGQPCRASFLLCLSCPCARVTPAHLPIIAETHDVLSRKVTETTPLRWAQRYAGPVAQLADVMHQYPDTIVDAARMAITDAQRDLVERLLNHGLDAR